MKNEQVHAIIGPQTSSQAKFVIELGGKAEVPIVSFSATSPTLSATRSNYFVRTAQNDSSQVKAIASIVQAYGWREIVPIYEDTEYGNGLVPFLLDAFQEIDTRVPYGSRIPLDFNHTQIMRELNKLKAMQKSIFLVHMSALLGSRLFLLAKEAGMMSEGYAWIVTDGLSALLDPVGYELMDSMQGVLGVRPHIPASKKLESFKSRWRKNFTTSKPQIKMNELNLFGLWAYDTVWAIAMAVEKAGIVHSGYVKPNTSESTDDIASLGKSEMGPRLLRSILSTRFQGLSGDFHLGWWRNGFTPDVFRSVVQALPFPLPYEFIPFVNKNKQSAGTYNELLYQIKLKRFDAVVGDVTIIANHSLYVDFTLPYSESGIRMLVLTKRDERDNMWIFLKPLSLELWLTTGIAFIFTGLVVWVLEHRENKEFRGKPVQQLGTTLWFSFSTLFFAHREKVVNNWTRFVLIIWIFVVLIISQSYTASLASMLTVKPLQPAFVDVKEIKRNRYFVGHQKNSFVKDFLVKELNFHASLLKEYETPEEYHHALSIGIRKGGVAAIFDEIPYVKLFLAKYGSKFQMVGPTYKTDGFGFAFPLQSPLVPYVSRAILKVTQDKDKMEEIERRNFGRETTCLDQASMVTSGGLSLPSFGGLFIITGVASMSALLIYVTKFLYIHWPASNTMDQDKPFYMRIIELAKHFDKEDPSAHHLKIAGSSVHPIPSVEIVGASPNIDDAHGHSSTSIEGSGDIIVDQDHDNHTPGSGVANPEPPHTP
ncbi:GLUTAMATE RECEPTOR [Salix viminalis]|uniref:Glutamate receptor n=1 Tax=Salix viminalis TaxID=40686 RepID=A0A9Q0SD97_SALVM|nr:GLUTAMATE RECEPTOR [Salix viminalis]